ncbi:MAG: SRPBCC family protein [Sciscionella sp.]|nr:SRPBCC family protein [Sciscionella sp.]
MDIVNQINAITREVHADGDGDQATRSVILRRRYDAQPADVWDACTNPERIGRWFLPVSGDFKLGGTYQLQGNAGGEILRCEPPKLLRLSWVFGDLPASRVELRLAPADDGSGTDFTLEHVVPGDDMWDQFGPGAVGAGWDGALLGLGLHLAGGSIDDPDAWQKSPEAKEFFTLSGKAWAAAYRSSGASAETVAAAEARTIAFYTGQPPTV